jgi:predicted  nucleic acid-binding Zn-ribbon protein
MRPSSFPRWLPLAVFALAVAGTLAADAVAQPGRRLGPPDGFGQPPAFGQPPGGMPGMMQEVWICQKCGHQWPKAGGGTPSSCPKCGVQFDFIQNQDGSKTTTTTGAIKTGAGFAKLLIFGVIALFTIGGAIVGLIRRASSGRKRPRRAVKRRPVVRDDDDDEDEDDRPRRPVRRPEPGDRPLPMARRVDDNADFEVVDDEPPKKRK